MQDRYFESCGCREEELKIDRNIRDATWKSYKMFARNMSRVEAKSGCKKRTSTTATAEKIIKTMSNVEAKSGFKKLSSSIKAEVLIVDQPKMSESSFTRIELHEWWFNLVLINSV